MRLVRLRLNEDHSQDDVPKTSASAVAYKASTISGECEGYSSKNEILHLSAIAYPTIRNTIISDRERKRAIITQICTFVGDETLVERVARESRIEEFAIRLEEAILDGKSMLLFTIR